MALKLYDPNTGNFDLVDYGNMSQGALLLNILIELRVHTQYLAALNQAVVGDDPSGLRNDIVSDPASLTPN